MSTPGQRTYSVDLIGFSTADRTVFASTFALSQRRPIRYLHHLESATRPDLYLVDADDLKAMVEFAARSPDAMHPAILIGADTHGTQWPCVARPIRWMKLFELLDRSVELAEQARRTVPSHVARNQWPFVDRRSRPRLDVDLDVADYTPMRASLNSTSAGVLGAVMTVPTAAGDEVREAAAGDPDIHILDLPPWSHLEINALQRGSTIVIQKSLREGFGLTVAEALLKRKPVVASAVGGIPVQVIHKVTGMLTHSVEGAAYQIRYLLANPAVARALGEKVWPKIESGAIKPVIFKTFALEEAAKAHALMESSQHIGKIVLTV